MIRLKCETCSGNLVREGNYLTCESCHNKYLINVADDVNAVARANAWEALRKNDFEKASELFEEIILKDKKDFESFWGLALAKASVVYVNDLEQDRKVPTLNNITEESFIENSTVKKAIALAPKEIGESYKTQAEYIENVRLEWLKKASKEPPYDVFISFKDSDRENGIERTQDSFDAQEIYTGLVDAGYKVFFSRYSLRGKVAEQYEPYIYNAIKTAKVMLVFGEKPEYFSSAWIKNEWSRFKARIDKGEKHKNSLVVIVKGMNPSDLPVALKSRQAMNMDDLTFFETLKSHIKRIIDESIKTVHLDKIEIKGGQIAKKATTLETNSIQTREIGAGATAQTDITEVQTLSLVDTYMKSGQWKDAAKLVDDVLFNNPACVEALWKKLLISKRVSNNRDFSNKLDEISTTDLQYVDKILNCAEQNFATTILDLLYDSGRIVSDLAYCQILKTILPYQYVNRKEKLLNAFTYTLNCNFKQTFSLLLSTLDSNDVDTYIKYNYEYAKRQSISAEKKECLDRIFKVDEGNIDALKMLLYLQLNDNENSETIINTFESLLKYSKNNREELNEILFWLGTNLNSLDDCALVKQVLRYSTDDISTWKTELLRLSAKMLSLGFFDEAEYLSRLILSFDPLNPTVYWTLCLIKLRAKSENEIKLCKTPLKTVPEYTKYLTLVDETRRQECFQLVNQQETLKKQKKKKAFLISLISTTGVALLSFIVFLITVIIPNALYNHYMETGEYGKIVKMNNLTSFTVPDNVTEIFDSAFADCDTLTTVIIPDGVTVIGEKAFENCINLTNITIPNSVTNIGNTAFYSCDSLTSVIIGDSVTSIGKNAFENCINLTNIIIPNSVTNIGGSAFHNCYKLVEVVNKSTHFTVTKGSTDYGYLGYYALAVYNSGDAYISILSNDGDYIIYTDGAEKILVGYNGTKTDIVIPSYITKIYQYAFYKRDNLISVIIPDSVTSIGHSAFEGCRNLTEITLPFVGKSKDATGYQAVFEYIFRSTTNSDSYMPTSLKKVTVTGGNIGEKAFYSCDSLTSVVIGDGVTSIGYRAFSSCYNLTSVEIGDGVTSIGSKAFAWCDRLTRVEIGDSVTSIGDSAFYGCSSLTSVVIGDSVTSIGYEAFASCDRLTSVVIPDSVTSIGSKAFAWCNRLTSVVIGDGVTSIDSRAFSGCDSLKSIVIPDSVTSIGYEVFYNCKSLKSIVIPDSVTSISSYAFYGCDSLASVYYKGTASEWASVTISSENSKLTGATRYYYSETKPTASGNYWHYDQNGNPVAW